MDTDFWTTVINGSANLVIAGAMVIQTVLLYITLKYAENKLNEIESKVKISNRELHKRKAMFELNEFKLVLFYAFNTPVADSDENAREKFQVINKKKSLYQESTISKLNLSVEISSFFLKHSKLYMSPLSKLATRLTLLDENHFKLAFSELEISIKNLFVEYTKIDKMVSNMSDPNYHLLDTEIQKVPKSYSDREHPLLEVLNEKIDFLERLLINFK